MSKQEKREKAIRIFKALSSVDVDLLVRAEERNRVLPFRRMTGALAACACLVMVGLVTWMGSSVLLTRKNAASDCAAPESMNQMRADTAADITTDGKFDSTDETTGAFAVEEEADVESALESGEAEEAAGVDELGTGLAQSEVQKGHDITDTYDSVAENQGAQSEMCVDTGQPMEETREYLSEEELRAVEKLGEYIPTLIPEGYIFESGYRMYEGGINLCWSKGMDSIMLSISVYEATEESEARIVDISKPETYDEQLYEIPYASTVPAEYRQVFDNPIFRESDFSETVVWSRMKRMEDIGDTDTPGGRFYVLYDSGVIVYFNGDCDAGQVWEMFCSIEAAEIE